MDLTRSVTVDVAASEEKGQAKVGGPGEGLLGSERGGGLPSLWTPSWSRRWYKVGSLGLGGALSQRVSEEVAEVAGGGGGGGGGGLIAAGGQQGTQATKNVDAGQGSAGSGQAGRELVDGAEAGAKAGAVGGAGVGASTG